MIAREPPLELAGDDHRRGAGDDVRVALFRDEITEADRAAAADAVVDVDRLRRPFVLFHDGGDHPHHVVGAAAGRVGNDDLDVLRRVLGLAVCRARRREHERQRRCRGDEKLPQVHLQTPSLRRVRGLQARCMATRCEPLYQRAGDACLVLALANRHVGGHAECSRREPGARMISDPCARPCHRHEQRHRRQRPRHRRAQRRHRHAHVQSPRGAQRDDLGDVRAALPDLRGSRRRRLDPRPRPQGRRRQGLRRRHRHRPVHRIQGRRRRPALRARRRPPHVSRRPRQEAGDRADRGLRRRRRPRHRRRRRPSRRDAGMRASARRSRARSATACRCRPMRATSTCSGPRD